MDYDEFAALMLSFSFVAEMGFVVSGNLEYTKEVVEPETFKPFVEIQPQYSNTMRISNHTDFVTQFVEHQGKGRRYFPLHQHFKPALWYPPRKNGN